MPEEKFHGVPVKWDQHVRQRVLLRIVEEYQGPRG
jgi:hypothetical protein